jgi:hypothetical protein
MVSSFNTRFAFLSMVFYIARMQLAGKRWEMPFLFTSREMAKAEGKKYNMRIVGEINMELNPPRVVYY